MIRYKSILVICLISVLNGVSQTATETLNLQECIDIALERNLDLKSSFLISKTAEVNFKRSRNGVLPTINGTYNIGKTSGRSIDPFTNSYIDEKLTFSNAGLNLNTPIFNGFRVLNQWRMSKLNWKAADMEREDTRHNLILNVTLTYLQVVNAKDLYNIAKNRLESTNGQFDRLNSMFEEDMGNPAEFRDFEGLKANDESNLILAKNNYEDAITALKELLNLDSELDVVAIDIPNDFAIHDAPMEDIYNQALDNMAIVKAGEYRLQASQKGVAVARANFVPEVTFFANLNTNYSSVAQTFNQTGTSLIDTGDFVSISGTDYSVQRDQPLFVGEDISYQDQFENNLYSAIGLQVNIPLFNGFEAKNRVALEKIKKEEAGVNLERIKLQLRSAIEQTYKDMTSAFERYTVLKAQNDAYLESYRVNEIRFTNGIDNSVSYIISKNNLENARVNLNNVKYEYLLRTKLLDYYIGQY